MYQRDLVAIVSHQKKEIYMCTTVEYTEKLNAEQNLRKNLIAKNDRKDGADLCNMSDSTFVILAVVRRDNLNDVKNQAQVVKSDFSKIYQNCGYNVISSWK
ncbi:hypothetical protein [Vibrio vulnificus]|uniref:hypothetical protein n=1 Tax=Vibrio vulnificus TaxID=672 RepID=UPI003F666D2C